LKLVLFFDVNYNFINIEW